MFQSVDEMTAAVRPAASVLSDRVSVTNAAAVTAELVDGLVWTAAFGTNPELRGTARWVIRSLALASGIRPASGVLEHDALDDVRHVLALVGRRLERLVDGLELDQLAHVRLVAEQP